MNAMPHEICAKCSKVIWERCPESYAVHDLGPPHRCGQAHAFVRPNAEGRANRPKSTVNGPGGVRRQRQEALSHEALDPPSQPVRRGPKGSTDVDPRNMLNDLTATEWVPETVSVWTQRGLGADHIDARIERQHPAPFSFTDVSRLVRFFTKSGGVVLDPFVGVGSTLKACALEGRRGIGFELNPRYASLANERLEKELGANRSGASDQQVVVGDARELVKALPSESVDFVVTSPPYWNILRKEDHKARQERTSKGLDARYGDDARDLGNLADYQEFVQSLSVILGDCARALRVKRYMALVVSDFRDKSRYIMFHSDLAASMAPFGLELKGITILYQRHKRVFPYGYPFAHVPNIHHQYIMIFQKA